MPALAEAFVAVRADTSRVQDDIAKGFDKAGPAGDAAGKKTGTAFQNAAGNLIASAAKQVGRGIEDFLSGSVDAYKEAESSQAKLSDAFEKFPALADTNQQALQDLNSELQRKTRADDDALAVGQATLAQFGLTGAQITQLTPLLNDYAAKTGTDLPTAAEQLGKAMLGQGRALKGVGIDFKDAGSLGGNFDQVMSGLRTNVGGFAEKEGKTAAGQAEILKNQFGELQETVGSKLLPILQGLGTFLIEHQGQVVAAGIAVAALGAAYAASAAYIALTTAGTTANTLVMGVAKGAAAAWTAVQWALNVALTANPIGLVVVGIAALIAIIVVIATKTTWFQTIWEYTWGAITVAASWAWDHVLKPVFGYIVSSFQNTWAQAQQFAAIVKAVWDTVWKAVETAWNFMSRTFDAIKAGIESVKTGVSTALDNVVGFFSGLPGRIISAVGNIGGLLYGKGKDVIQGFWDGLTSVWSNVTGWVSGIASWIREHKGPLSLDRTLLQPAGVAMMTGFFEGLKSGAGPAWDFVTSVGGKAVSALQSAFGGGGATVNAGRISFQGGLLDTDTFARIKAALGDAWSLTQGSWSTAVAASAGTHAGSGVADIHPLGDSWYGAQAKLRAAGLDAWFRDWANNQHIHLVNPNVSGLSSQALAQTLSFLRGGTGLAFDQGGWLPTGTTLAVNNTGRPERILGPGEGGGVHVTVNVSGSVTSERDLARRLRDELMRLGLRGDALPA